MGEIINKIINGTVENDKTNQKNGKRKVKILPIKKFEIRDSLITQLCQNPHIKVVKNIFAASLVGLFLNTVIHDYLERGEFKLGFNVIAAGMGKFYWVIITWIILNICALLAYQCFNLWAETRINLQPKSKSLRLWDWLWLGCLTFYYVAQFRVISVLVGYLKLPIVSSAIVCLEQTRLLMKIHAFVRTTAEKVINFKPHSDQKLKIATLNHYIYFLFAPTIVYADEYPRNNVIRWKFVLEKVVELVGVIFYYAFLIERFIIPAHKDIGLRPFSINELILTIFDNFAVGLMFLLLGFYVVIDTVQNLGGELLRFGDRKFYSDWWTCTNYSDYFRTWNMVVGDWLYTYIYKDVYEHVLPGNKLAAKFIVFFISAVVHEWALTYMFGFFFPALFLSFSFSGCVLSFLTTPKLDIINVIFWYMLAFGSGQLVSVYAMEWFVRGNMPIENPTFWDFVVPRLVTCNCITY